MRATTSQRGTEEQPSNDGREGVVHGRSEEIHVRNFDVQRTYDLTVQVRDDDGIVFASRYHLTPGKTVSELDRLPAGRYEVTVRLGGRREQTVRCEVDETPDHTVLIEVGNGTVSVTEGLYT